MSNPGNSESAHSRTAATPRDRPSIQTPAEAQAVLEMMAQVFSLGVATFHTGSVALLQEQRRLAPVTEGEDAIITVDDDAIVTSFSETAERIFGYSASAIVGRQVAILFDSAGVNAESTRNSDERLRLGIPLDAVGKRREGNTFAVEMSSTVVEIGGQRRFVMSVRDLTERDRANAQKRALHRRRRRSRIGNVLGEIRAAIDT